MYDTLNVIDNIIIKVINSPKYIEIHQILNEFPSQQHLSLTEEHYNNLYIFPCDKPKPKIMNFPNMC